MPFTILETVLLIALKPFADLRLQCLYLFLQIGDFSLNRLTFGRKLLVKIDLPE